MQIKKTVWQPLVLGVVFGLLAGLTMVTGLSFLIPGITDNAIGVYATLFLLAAALGGPLAGTLAPAIFVTLVALLGPPDMQAILNNPDIFWPNLLALAATLVLVSFAYRLIFERVKMPIRLLPWAGIVIVYYLISIPASVIPQYLLSGDPRSEILPAVLSTYLTYFPQVIFDIVFTSLVFIALPERYRKPLWYQPKKAPDQNDKILDEQKKSAL